MDKMKKAKDAVVDAVTPGSNRAGGESSAFAYGADWVGGNLDNKLQSSHPAPQVPTGAYSRAHQNVNAQNEAAPEGLKSTAWTDPKDQHQNNEAPKLKDPATGTMDSSVEQQTSQGTSQEVTGANTPAGGGTYTTE